MVLVALFLGIVLVPAVGGTFGALREAHLRAAMLVPIALILQMLPAREGFLPIALNVQMATVTCWIAGALMLLTVCVRNWRLHGMQVIAVGVFLNALVILANMGMPVGLSAAGLLGDNPQARQAVAQSPLYQLETETSRMIVLADVLPVPGPGPVRAIVSLGDLMLFTGIVVTIVQSSGVGLVRQTS
jgi:hypothetical protein